MNIVILDNQEEFLQFLDPDLCEIEEKISTDSIRSIKLTYKFQDYNEDKKLFRIGNKIWINNDINLKDCLYVINTTVETDIFDENSFSLSAEEILVELNYAPIFTQNEITASNGFTYTDTNGKREVTVDWNALNYWFGRYFNIGIIQEVTTGKLKNISLSGTMTLMSLLRYIEECTGNIFVTRYEKDCLGNTIHRYLDFLNPLSVKPWVLNLEYDFLLQNDDEGVRTEDGKITSDETEDTSSSDDDKVEFADYTPHYSLDPSVMKFRITDGMDTIVTSDNQLVEWEAESIGLTSTSKDVVIQLVYTGEYYALTINNKSYAILGTNEVTPVSNGYVEDWTELTSEDMVDAVIPDDSYFEIYDTANDCVVFQTQINYILGHVHSEILNFGLNVENVEYDIDETDTVRAVQPILSLSENTGQLNSISRSDMQKIINSWKNLTVKKGDIIPLTLEKFNIQGSSLANAQSTLKTKNINNNYWNRPVKPNDNTTSSNNNEYTYEFYRATSYTRAPFTKEAGELFVATEMDTGITYDYIHTRPDQNVQRDKAGYVKTGSVSTNEEDPYMIYQAVCADLKTNMYPDINLDVEVANLKNNEYNDYDLYDKVYLKIPTTKELITARVTKTTKKAHDIAKNTIELSNYSILDHGKQNATYINAENASWKYPAQKTVTAQLVNMDYDSSDSSSIQYPANQMITFRLYTIENNTTTLAQVYNKITDVSGTAKLHCNLDPGKYQLEMVYGGDEEYLNSDLTIELTVGGTKPKPETKTKTKAKTKTKTKAKTTKVKKYTYYDKWGRSPDKKKILAIGKRSASRDPGSDAYYYQTQFKNKCPHCGHQSLIWGIWWAGKHRNYGTFTHPSGRKQKEGGSIEGHIFCTHCDADYSVFGNEHVSRGKKLTITKKPAKSSQSKATKLRNGKMVYDFKYVTQSVVQYTKNRTHSKNIPNSLIKRANSIVGKSTGTNAAKKIAKWCASNVKYSSYNNFRHSATWVNTHRQGNCCDQTRYMLSLMDAAGCMEYFDIYFVHVSTSGRGHVFAKLVTKTTKNWRYVDPCKIANPWGNYVHGYGTAPGRQTKYTGWNQINTTNSFFIS